MSEVLTDPTQETLIQRVAQFCKDKGFFVHRAVGDGFDDPLAVHIGLGVGAQDIPADGWPKDFNKDIALEILGYLEDIND